MPSYRYFALVQTNVKQFLPPCITMPLSCRALSFSFASMRALFHSLLYLTFPPVFFLTLLIFMFASTLCRLLYNSVYNSFTTLSNIFLLVVTVPFSFFNLINSFFPLFHFLLRTLKVVTKVETLRFFCRICVSQFWR